MAYRFATERADYSDYAGGQFFYAMPGHPALPIRLASELLQRCLAIRQARRQTTPCRLYDPCCGGAYHLATLAFLHWHAITEIVASDIDEQALELAARNLSLLTQEGFARRRAEVAELLAAHGKESHRATLEIADRLQPRLRQNLRTHPIAVRLFRADATDGARLSTELRDSPADVVLTDLPYGRQATWQIDAPVESAESPLWRMLEALRGVAQPSTLVAIVADKRQKIAHPQYRRVEYFRAGKRQATILEPL